MVIVAYLGGWRYCIRTKPWDGRASGHLAVIVAYRDEEQEEEERREEEEEGEKEACKTGENQATSTLTVRKKGILQILCFKLVLLSL